MSDVFEVKATELEPFRFRLPGESEIRELPHLGTMPISIKKQVEEAAAPMRRAMKAGKQPSDRQARAAGEAMVKLFEAAQPGLTSLVDESQLIALAEGWQAHSEITVGESQASASS